MMLHQAVQRGLRPMALVFEVSVVGMHSVQCVNKQAVREELLTD